MVKTGHLIKVRKNQFFPADLILLKSSSSENTCFVETKNLDGETNLKCKTAAAQNGADISSFDGKMVVCEPPSDQIYTF